MNIAAWFATAVMSSRSFCWNCASDSLSSHIAPSTSDSWRSGTTIALEMRFRIMLLPFEAAKSIDRTVVIHVPADRYEGVPDYESWWEVPVAEVSASEEVRKARKELELGEARRRWYL